MCVLSHFFAWRAWLDWCDTFIGMTIWLDFRHRSMLRTYLSLKLCQRVKTRRQHRLQTYPQPEVSLNWTILVLTGSNSWLIELPINHRAMLITLIIKQWDSHFKVPESLIVSAHPFYHSWLVVMVMLRLVRSCQISSVMWMLLRLCTSVILKRKEW